jgi:WD40 repeat protein
MLTTLDLKSGERAIPSYESPGGMVIGVAAGEVDGHALAMSGEFFGFSGTGAGILRVWDLTDAEKPLRGSLVGHYGGSKALTIIQLDNRPVLVSGGSDHTVRAWELKDSWTGCQIASASSNRLAAGVRAW